MKRGFTLVELLVVMAIIGVLVALSAASFRSAQLKGRDAQRKSDLREVAQSLELYYTDYKKYPDESQIVWGSEFVDSKGTIFFKKLPTDPSSSLNYVYNIVDPPLNQKYQLFARLENTQDKSIITNLSADCGESCNFAITSANASATE